MVIGKLTGIPTKLLLKKNCQHFCLHPSRHAPVEKSSLFANFLVKRMLCITGRVGEKIVI
ncbi:hypothetical protein NEOC84_000439|nr:hypothetical protein [Neochlamydia sp. AcF84]